MASTQPPQKRTVEAEPHAPLPVDVARDLTERAESAEQSPEQSAGDRSTCCLTRHLHLLPIRVWDWHVGEVGCGPSFHCMRCRRIRSIVVPTLRLQECYDVSNDDALFRHGGIFIFTIYIFGNTQCCTYPVQH